MKRTLLVGILYTSLFFIVYESNSQTVAEGAGSKFTWTGDSPFATDLWDDPDNWTFTPVDSDADGIPDPNDSVYVEQGKASIVNVNFTITKLTILAPTGSGTQPSNVTLQEGVTLRVNGKTIIRSTSTAATTSRNTRIASISISNLAILQAVGDIEMGVISITNPERAMIVMEGASFLDFASNLWLQSWNGTSWTGKLTGEGTLSSSNASTVRLLGRNGDQTFPVKPTFTYHNIELGVTSAGGTGRKYLSGSLSTANVTGELLVTTDQIVTSDDRGESNPAVYADNNYTITGVPVRLAGSNSKKLALKNVDNLIFEGTGQATLTRDVNINSTLTLRAGAGNINTDTYNLIINNTASAAIVNEGTARVIGNLRRMVTTETDYLYPIGTSGAEENVRINLQSITGDLQYLSMQFNTEDPLLVGDVQDFEEDGAEFIDMLQDGYWEITPDQGSATYTLSLYPSFLGGASAYSVAKRDSPDGPVWYKDGDVVNVADTPDGIQPDGSIVRTGMSGFSNFGVFASSTPFPVELEYFKAKLIEEYVNLDWATLAETKSSHFEIQRSRDAKNFETIGTVQSAGNSSEKIEYNYKDITATDILADKLYYRLKQVDVDGVFQIYPMQVVNVGDIIRNHKISIHPNPASEEVNVVSYLKENIQLQVFTPQGNKVGETEVGSEKTVLNTSKYKQGVYVFKFISGSTVVNKKVIIQ